MSITGNRVGDMDPKSGIYPSTELVGSYFSNLCSGDADLASKARDDIKGALFTFFNLNLSGVEACVAENGENDINLVLPYYSALDHANTVKVLDSVELESASGGEIAFTAIAILFGFTSMAAGVAISGAMTVGVAGVAAGVATGGYFGVKKARTGSTK